MVEIKVAFYVLGALFGIKNSRIAAEKTLVTVDPIAKTIVIVEEDLFTVIQEENDSVLVSEEFLKIQKRDWIPEIQGYDEKSVEFYTDENNLLNAKVVLKYNTFEDLSTYALGVAPNGDYSLIQVPNWNVESIDGQLNDMYWNFDASKPFSFTMEAYKDMPEKYRADKVSLTAIWEAANKG